MSKLLSRLLLLCGALLFLQLPLFIHQYKMELVGHVAELRWQVDQMHTIALKGGKNLEQYIDKFLHQSDMDIAHQGALMERTLKRFHRLSRLLAAFESSSTLTRPWVFLSSFQWEIAKSTLHAFSPGIPFSLEGLIYALLGAGLGALLYRLLAIIWHNIICEK